VQRTILVFKQSEVPIPSVKQLKQAGFHLSSAVGAKTTDCLEAKEKAPYCENTAGGQDSSD